MQPQLLLDGLQFPPPPCHLGLDDPEPLRAWFLEDVAKQVVTTGSLESEAIVVLADKMLRARLPVGAPRDPAVLGGAWGTIARHPGALRTFRTGLIEVPIDGAPVKCAGVMEHARDGRWWIAWWPIPADTGNTREVRFVLDEGPGAQDPIAERLAARWLTGFEQPFPEMAVGRAPEPPPHVGSDVYLLTAPLMSPVPQDVDKIAIVVDRLLLQEKSLLSDALSKPPVIVTFRKGWYERWVLRRAFPVGIDDVMRNLCTLGDQPPDAMLLLRPGNVLYDGVQRRSLECVIESGRRRLTRQLPLVMENVESATLWRDPVRRRLSAGEGWIGVRPTVNLDLQMDRAGLGGSLPEA